MEINRAVAEEAPTVRHARVSKINSGTEETAAGITVEDKRTLGVSAGRNGEILDGRNKSCSAGYLIGAPTGLAEVFSQDNIVNHSIGDILRTHYREGVRCSGNNGGCVVGVIVDRLKVVGRTGIEAGEYKARSLAVPAFVGDKLAPFFIFDRMLFRF